MNECVESLKEVSFLLNPFQYQAHAID